MLASPPSQQIRVIVNQGLLEEGGCTLRGVVFAGDGAGAAVRARVRVLAMGVGSCLRLESHPKKYGNPVQLEACKPS